VQLKSDLIKGVVFGRRALITGLRCIINTTWSLSDIDVAFPVCPTALAKTLSGSGVNLEKIVVNKSLSI
jgi:hypothetical protein